MQTTRRQVSPSGGVPSISPQNRASKIRPRLLLLHALTLGHVSPAMSSLRAISTLLYTYSSSAAAAVRGARRLGFAPPLGGSFRLPSKASSAFVFDEVARAAGGERRRVSTRAASWDSEESPYETLGMTKLSAYAPGFWNYDWYLGFCCVEPGVLLVYVMLIDSAVKGFDPVGLRLIKIGELVARF